ncbi:MAG: preprotein translocase subunit YajC [Micropruina sp.]
MELVLIPLMLVGAYFLLIRPQQKRAKETEAMAASLVPGSRVMTTSGVFATVKHLGEKQLIIEISPGVEMTVVKAAVLKVVNPEDDEFEYADADSDDAEPDDVAVADEAVPDEAWAAPADESPTPSSTDTTQK